MQLLTSKSNPKIKQAAFLVASAAARRQESLFVAEGVRLCLDAVKSGASIVETFVTTTARSKYEKELSSLFDASGTVWEIADHLAASLSDTQHPQGVFSVCEMPRTDAFRFVPEGVYLALDRVQTPDNLGAISRTAEALGLQGLLIGGGCDPFHPKALRASMGAFFRLPFQRADALSLLLLNAKKAGMTLLASVPDRAALPISALSKKHGLVCVIGNEGNGISEETARICDMKVTIPMSGRAESLNAAAAAAIIMWELMRQ